MTHSRIGLYAHFQYAKSKIVSEDMVNGTHPRSQNITSLQPSHVGVWPPNLSNFAQWPIGQWRSREWDYWCLGPPETRVKFFLLLSQMTSYFALGILDYKQVSVIVLNLFVARLVSWWHTAHFHDKLVQGNAFITIIITRCSAIAERPRCRVRYSFRQK